MWIMIVVRKGRPYIFYDPTDAEMWWAQTFLDCGLIEDYVLA